MIDYRGLLPDECGICGAQPGERCIPECDADELSDEQVANLAIARLIERGICAP